MGNLSGMLTRVVALCAMSALSELALPAGALKKLVRLIAGLLVAEVFLHLILDMPASLGLGGVL